MVLTAARASQSPEVGEGRRGGSGLDLAIRGGRVVTAGSDSVADIGIRDGRVVQIGGEVQPAVREIEAADKLVLPGGIDMHVHLTPVDFLEPPLHWVDDFTSGSQAAAAGGVTTVGNITFPRLGERLLATVDRVSEQAGRESIVDFVLHPVLVEPSPENLAEIPQLSAKGHSSLKIFMILGNFDARATDYLKALRLAGANQMITLIHCEDACVINFLVEELLTAGKGDPTHYSESRPVFTESAAVERAVAFCQAAAAPIYIVHLSSAEALAAATRARARGLPVYVETRPIYLVFTEQQFAGADAGLYVGNPPLRGEEDKAALWAALSTGQIQTCCTDHAPWTREEKLEPGLDIRTVRPGMADLEFLMPLLFTEGVIGGRLSLQKFVEITSTNAAKLFGLFPTKGTIAVGSDADLVVWDPKRARRLRGEEMFSKARFNLLEDRELTGWPVYTVSRGDVIFDNGRVIGDPGRGRLVPRGSAGTH
ncbi:amidohydrolase family protein [Candidatus Nephthysia bennettiae]|uniref:Amidohydrolase family protein n=1 Tax=Candidatus Nephthysia bennettiae TaxID=3127016 RepID=A0A934N5E0_9BACT|nr:amidohydrolase family protein [Candidatus Dormibacteraeota bacterium]